jgi:hypothetical protein
MEDIETRIENAIEEITGNESLLEMLDTDAATEMLAWGKKLVNRVVKQTKGLEDEAAEQALLPRLKAIRQTMRNAGNWAAGKYADPASRVPLRDKLLHDFRTIYGDDAKLPTTDEMDALLNEADNQQKDPHQLIFKLKALLNDSEPGDTNNVQKA